MEMPSIIHPSKFKINGYKFQVVSYANLTKLQAARIAQNFYHTQKLKKNDKEKTFTVITTFDEKSINLLG